MIDRLNSRFKKFGGEQIPDLIAYLKEYLSKDPEVTISVGCDSKQLKSKTIYANTVMLYNGKIHNGAHVIFFREYMPKILDTFTRLYTEAEKLHYMANYICDNLQEYKRSDLTEWEMKKYKFHTQQHLGKYIDLDPIDEYNTINAQYLTEIDKVREYKLVDIHVDFNLTEGDKGQNRSYSVYRSSVPWLKGEGFRVFTKPYSPCSASAADLLLK